MTRKELREKQHKVALDFFEKLQKDFDHREIEREGATKRSYKGWYFEWADNSNVCEVQFRDSNHQWISIKGKKKLMRKIKRFIEAQYDRKQEEINIRAEFDKITPLETAIEESFGTPATEIHNSLNQ